ncbi:hypothetical protein NM208_g3154 [Fusarium decemcellulare]|uniref:Uncharacterized protein n=1 Tax=Fusarium decemcellulare TaxID=57161 RepID=A0ACC1SQG7_9HYPO|nr:hypothetical protein NM208_g3154 [Fusarium decemcellulare]
MQSLFLFIFSILALTSNAFELTIYNNVGGCDAKDDTMYRILGGASNGTCYTFDDPMPLTYCSEFKRGGWEGPGGCQGGSLLPQSIIQQNPIPCTFYSEKNCQGTSQQTIDTCVDGSSLGISNWKSFSCTSDDTVDILANVGCHNTVSTNVCVNDCGFHCKGQILVPGTAPLCQPESIALCSDESCEGYFEL